MIDLLHLLRLHHHHRVQQTVATT